ncbi:MAG: SufD family Fe-S cluster assembly protein, partial [Puniceicoccales bacterium]|nr:SufD family Fe-S cluster assembly protein [Puniceicoccales bacterium]
MAKRRKSFSASAKTTSEELPPIRGKESFSVSAGTTPERLLSEAFSASSETASEEPPFWGSYGPFDQHSGGAWRERELRVSQSGSRELALGEEPIQKDRVVVAEEVELSLQCRVRSGHSFLAQRLCVELHRGARLKFVLRLEEGGAILSALRFVLAEGAFLEILLSQQGVRRSRLELDLQLRGEGSSATALLTGFGRGEQRLDCRVRQVHRASRTESRLRVKTALEDRACAVFGGQVVMEESAANSTASQKAEQLMLSPEALAHSLPDLDIRTDAASCSHGATVAPLDETALFYLGTRGIDCAVARQVLREAFLGLAFDFKEIGPA